MERVLFIFFRLGSLLVGVGFFGVWFRDFSALCILPGVIIGLSSVIWLAFVGQKEHMGKVRVALCQFLEHPWDVQGAVFINLIHQGWDDGLGKAVFEEFLDNWLKIGGHVEIIVDLLKLLWEDAQAERSPRGEGNAYYR